MKIAKSPDRFTFQKEAYIARCREEGTEPSESYLAMYDQQQADAEQRIEDAEWQKDNLEFDLRTTDWIIEKCQDDIYAQHLYAAMCNMRWQRMEVFPILKDQYWSCSWRFAGGIVADIQGKGDYIDWYCSGIRNDSSMEQTEQAELTEEQELFRMKIQAYVSEGVVTDEIKSDLARLGWQPVEWEDDE
jgi:hypothetical protein